jgi:uncharacterized membrane protein YdbT with pleckstrin-like domain
MTPDLPTSAHHIRGSVILLTLKVGGLLLITGAFYAAFLLIFIFGGVGDDLSRFVLYLLWGLHTVKFFIEVYVTLYLVTHWARTSYYLSEHHLIRYEGIMQVDEHLYDLRAVRSVDVYENWLGRLLNFGDIHMVVADSGYREDLWLRGIAAPRKYEKVFRGFLEPEPKNVEEQHYRQHYTEVPPSTPPVKK